ncbi:MAG TPA: N-acetyltransferase [Deltaproteobacteria bacterium]|jgi:amino-acid N-acetyltransferase|nr:N-acetyltransferase [Deltaproteobacteria bacterium]HOI06509.1 N-acetyltransferase [Deltaproteobacteria bacterium]
MIRKLLVSEVVEVKNLIDPFVKEGLMLPKSLHALCQSVRDFWVVTGQEGGIIGCCALQVSWLDTAEIRTLAVKKEHQGKGLGRTLVNECIKEATQLGIKSLFALTYVPGLFKSAGFQEVEKSTLPNKIWSDCIHCQYFPDCREVALTYRIGG